jgi:RNA polymerase sigma factor (sigma-70 family)
MTVQSAPRKSESTRQIRVLVVDDHLVTRLGLRSLLGGYGQIEVVGDAASVAEAVAETCRLLPDVVLLDVRLPDGTGFDACRQIRKLERTIRILMLTSYADDELVFASLDAGADGYLLKEIDGAGLVRAIENVAAGKAILDPVITRRVMEHFRSRGSNAEFDRKLAQLSAQERRVLALIAQGKTNKEIAHQMGLSDKTVKNYVSNTLDKLKLTRRSEAAAFYVQTSR